MNDLIGDRARMGANVMTGDPAADAAVPSVNEVGTPVLTGGGISDVVRALKGLPGEVRSKEAALMTGKAVNAIQG